MLHRPIWENLNQVSPPRSITPSTAEVPFLRRSGAKGASRDEWGKVSAPERGSRPCRGSAQEAAVLPNPTEYYVEAKGGSTSHLSGDVTTFQGIVLSVDAETSANQVRKKILSSTGRGAFSLI